MDFQEFPKVLYHPNAMAAVNQGAPATFPPVTVESPYQEAESLAKGYQTTPQDAQAFVRSVLATVPPGYESQLCETVSQAGFVALEHPGQGTQILVADGDHPAVEVAALDLDHPDVTAQQLPLGELFGLQAAQVDLDGPLAGAGRRVQLCIRPVGHRTDAGEQLIDRHPVERGQAL